MITVLSIDSVTHHAEYTGLSTDTKPTNAENGSAFLEMDTSKVYVFDAQNSLWKEI